MSEYENNEFLNILRLLHNTDLSSKIGRSNTRIIHKK